MVWKHVIEPERPGVSYACPCCKHLTLSSRGHFEICDVCFWEDDGQDEHDADVVRGGPNHDLSLRQAQLNYRSLGAVEASFIKSVRAPRPDEVPETGK
jgi:hypothetical protein